MHPFRIWVGSLLLLSSVLSVSPAAYAAKVGSPITFELPNENQERSGIFLGRLIDQDGTDALAMLLDPSSRAIFYIPAGEIQGWDTGFEPILKPYQQKGGTCTGYAIDHLLVQMSLEGFRGNGELATELATEEGRSGLLVDAINQYYLVTQHQHSIEGILNDFGKAFGFHCRSEKYASAEKARARILEKLTSGLPVLISFGVGTQMADPDFTFTEYDQAGNPSKLDPGIWIPRTRGERSGGAHSIVAVASFELAGRPELLVLDSDFAEPRIWDLEKFISDRTAVGEIEILNCAE